MAVFKIVFEFDTSVRSSGWSESYYTNADGQTECIAKGTQLAQARVGMLAPSYTLHYMRCTANTPLTAIPNVRAVRKASLTNLSLKTKPGGGTGSTPDLPWQAVLVRLQDISKEVFRMFLIRGIPDELWSNGNDDQAQLFLRNTLKFFSDALKATGCGILHRTGGNPPLALTPIESATFERMAKRNTGRPFAQDRGRR